MGPVLIPFFHAFDFLGSLTIPPESSLDIWVCNSGLLGPPSIDATTPADLIKCLEVNALAPFYALKYAPPAMGKTTPQGNYPNAAEKDRPYGSIVVVSSVASTYGGECDRLMREEAKEKCLHNEAGCWGPCYTMSSHAALGVVRAGVSVLKGTHLVVAALVAS